jgi:hypothetical protein
VLIDEVRRLHSYFHFKIPTKRKQKLKTKPLFVIVALYRVVPSFVSFNGEMVPNKEQIPEQ